MPKTKENLTTFILQLLYYYKKLYSMNSIMGTLMFEYYEIKQIEREKKEKIRKQKKKIQDAVYYLKKSGYIKGELNENIKITPRGAIKYIAGMSKNYQPPKLTSHKKYLIMFDVPEKHRRIRDLLRKVLYNFGSEMLQKSVFVIQDKKAYDFVKNLIKYSQIDQYVKFIQIKSIDDMDE